MKIALFGGRFDPPHNGHIAAANAVLQFDQSIDQLWFLPTPHHHWKPSMASANDRLAMVRLLETKRIKVSDFDILHDTTYAIDTVRHLQEQTNNEYIWICGADIVSEFHRWKAYQELQNRISFLVIPRNPYDILKVPENFQVMRLPGFIPTQYSSTEIRLRIGKGESINGLVPEKVVEYITSKGLYI